MTLIVFLIDTSASMGQKNYRGSSALDICKNFVFDFVKARGRDSAKNFDRYTLLTTEEFPSCVKEQKISWRENLFLEHMKSLKPNGKHSMSAALLATFQYMNSFRQSTGIESYGYGRYPYYMEQMQIICMTDRNGAEGIPSDFKLELRSRNELTREAYRWDQKMFTVVIRMPAQGTPYVLGTRIDPDVDNIERLCTATGGRSFSLVSHKQITPCVESVLQVLPIQGIGVRFHCPSLLAPTADRPLSSEDQRARSRMDARPITTVIVRMAVGKPLSTYHWPIPESYWNTRTENGSLPLRSAHPVLIYSLEPSNSLYMTDFPFDKYELEPSPVVDFVRSRLKDDPEKCLNVFVQNSGRQEGYGKPLGYLKLTSLGGVNLVLMAYNYPVILQLLEELKSDQSLRNSATWRKRLDLYLESVPPYYLPILRKSLTKFKLSGGLLDEQAQPVPYPAPVMNHLNRLRLQGKEEHERLMNTINGLIQQQQMTALAPAQQLTSVERRPRTERRKHWRSEMEAERRARERARDKERDREREQRKNAKDPRAAAASNSVSTTPADDRLEMFKDPESELKEPDSEKTEIQMHISEVRHRPTLTSSFRNPLNMRSEQVITQLPRMRANITMLIRDSPIPLLEGGRPGSNIKLHHAEELHSLPISQMGNYDEYTKAMIAIGRAPLREVEPQAVRAHAFGNPFKTDKKSLAIDEVGEGPALDAPSTSTTLSRRDRRDRSQTNRPPRRKPGPLGSNSMSMWRERRRTISERSSVVSDISYTSDLDDVPMLDDGAGPSEQGAATVPTPKALSSNGFVFANGHGTSPKVSLIEVGLKDWGLEEEEDEEEGELTSGEPPAKKTRTSASAGNNNNVQTVPKRPKNDVMDTKRLRRDMSSEGIAEMKLRIASLVRQPANGPTVFRDMVSVVSDSSMRDALELFEFALRDSRRFKRKALSSQLESEVLRRRKLVSLL